MNGAQLKVVHVRWSPRGQDEQPPWDELEISLMREEVDQVQAAFTVRENTPEGECLHVVAIGKVSWRQ